MASEDFIDLDPSDDTMDNSERVECKSTSEPIEVVNLEQGLRATDRETDNAPVLEESIGLVETVTTFEQVDREVKPVKDDEENGFLGTPIIDSPRDHDTDTIYTSGRKRARTTYVDDEPSVRVIYRSLTRASIKKVEDFMQQWSQWHARHVSSNLECSKEVLESGEETFFPALHVGSKESKSVSFWVDNQGVPEPSKASAIESDSAPLYDRGYVTGLSSLDCLSHSNGNRIEEVEASRCFNCSSYNHSLKECPKPRDNVAVNNARRQHNLKRNVASGPRCPTRYYQNSLGGKFEGLKPGSLSTEARQCLGIGELDPPPWLNRMREIGYPPGYLDVEDQPSGITIFADEDPQEEREDGEIQETAEPEMAEKKMTVEFPGLNAPIPPNADERSWTPMPSANMDSHRSRSYMRSDVDRGSHLDERRSRSHWDESPPGVEPFKSSYREGYGIYNSGSSREHQHSRGHDHMPRRPDLDLSLSDRGGRNPSALDGSLHQSSNYNAYPYSSYTRWSSQNLDRWNPEGQYSSSPDSSLRNDRHGHRYHYR